MVIIYTSSRRAVLRRFAALLIAPQRFVCYYASCRTTPQRFLSRCPASQLNDLFVTPLHFASLCSSALRLAPLLCTPQLNNLFVTTHRAALLLDASPRTNVHRISAQRDDLFVTSPRSALLLRSTYRNATRLNDLFVTSLHYTPLRFAALFSDTHRSSSLLNDLFVTKRRMQMLDVLYILIGTQVVIFLLYFNWQVAAAAWRWLDHRVFFKIRSIRVIKVTDNKGNKWLLSKDAWGNVISIQRLSGEE